MSKPTVVLIVLYALLLSMCVGDAQYTPPGGGGSSGSVVLTTGSGVPAANCAPPTSSNLAVYIDTTNQDQWWCSATNTWKKLLSTTGVGPYVVTGAAGTAPSNPASGELSCYFDSTSLQQICLDTSGNASTMVRTGAPELITATCTGANTFAAGSIVNASKTLTTTGSCSLGVTGMVARGTYNLLVTQGSGGSHTLTLSTGGTGGCAAWLVSGGGGGAVTPTVTAGAVDMLVWYYDGTNCYANYTKTFN